MNLLVNIRFLSHHGTTHLKFAVLRDRHYNINLLGGGGFNTHTLGPERQDKHPNTVYIKEPSETDISIKCTL